MQCKYAADQSKALALTLYSYHSTSAADALQGDAADRMTGFGIFPLPSWKVPAGSMGACNEV